LLRQQLASIVNRRKEYALELEEVMKKEKTYKQSLSDSQETQQAILKHRNMLQNQRDAVLKQRTSLEEKKESYQQQVKDLESQISAMKKDLNAAKRFPCSKINADCPFIEQIASASLGKFTKQVKLLEEQLHTLRQSFDAKKWGEEYHETIVAFKEISDQIQLLTKKPEQVIPDFFAQQEKNHQRLRDEVTTVQQKIQQADLETQEKNLEKHIEQL
jgi:hypothetical protein